MKERFTEKLHTVRGKLYCVIWLCFWCAAAGYLLLHYSAVIGEDPEQLMLWKPIFAGTLVIVLSAAWWCTRRWLLRTRPERPEDKKRIRVWNFFALGANAVCAFLIMETVNNELLKDMKFAYMALNVLGIYIISLIFLFWLNFLSRRFFCFSLK